jgi:group I intron endonuclease
MACIYAIICYDTGEIYVGSTEQELHRRMSKHINSKEENERPCKSKQIIERNEYDVIKLEECDIDDKKIREQVWLDKFAMFNLVNAQRSCRTPEQVKEQKNAHRKTPEGIIKRKEKMECGCGGVFRIEDKSRHYRTNKHKSWADKK